MTPFFTNNKVKPLNVLLLIFFLVATVAPSYYFYRQNQKLKARLSSQPNQEEVTALVAKVGRHILLPSGEIPTVLTVTDKDKLSGQQFFANAKNGDKVLVYNTAKKAFLYDTVADRVIEVGPVTVATSPTPTPAGIRFVLYNGTTVVGLTKKYETELKKKVPAAVVVDRDNAKKQDYATSLLIDNTAGGNPQTAEIVKVLGIALGKLPAGEATSAAQFTIIVGADKN